MANILIRSNAAGWVSNVVAFDNPYTCKGPRDLEAMASGSQGVSRTVRVDMPMTVRIQHRSGTLVCTQGLSFQPRKAHRYLLQLSAAGQACQMNLYDATEPSEMVLEDTAVKRNPKPTLLDGMDGCEARTASDLKKEMAEAGLKRFKAAFSLDDFKDILPR